MSFLAGVLSRGGGGGIWLAAGFPKLGGNAAMGVKMELGLHLSEREVMLA